MLWFNSGSWRKVEFWRNAQTRASYHLSNLASSNFGLVVAVLLVVVVNVSHDCVFCVSYVVFCVVVFVFATAFVFQNKIPGVFPLWKIS